MAFRRILPAVLALATLLSIAACQKHEPASPGATPPATASAAPGGTHPAPGSTAAPRETGARMPALTLPKRDTTLVDATVTDVRLSNRGDAATGAIGPVQDAFARTDTVYADVDTSGSAGSYSLYAKWTAPDNTVLSDYGVHVGQQGDVHTIISLSKPDGWVPGEYRIELAINGKAQRTVTFQVH